MNDRKGPLSAFRVKESALEAAKTFRLSVEFRPKGFLSVVHYEEALSTKFPPSTGVN